MNPSKLLQKFLHTGNKPSSQRESSALLDESRSLLVSKLPTTGETIQNFTAAELAKVNLKGGNVLDQMHKAYLEKQSFKPTNTPSTMQVFTSPRKTSAPPTAKPAATAATSKPVIHRATATATKPSAPAPLATITAAQFAKPELRMVRSQFDLLSPDDKGRFCASGGKLVADPKPAKK